MAQILKTWTAWLSEFARAVVVQRCVANFPSPRALKPGRRRLSLAILPVAALSPLR
jgi:hypothetical protein